ncbi:MAG: NnrU family protein [Myxococcales bacterium]|nr:NnrU family protein [Myxococcales bacterium]MDH5566651.1 NnrU family protein [Myxococcales bacterium]
MDLLVLGVLLWCAVHLMPSVARPLRQALVSRLGEGRYRGVFALFILAALVLIVLGWRSTPAVVLFAPPAWGRAAAGPLVLLALFSFAASQKKTNVDRLIRHPQLTGVAIWAAAHLLCNAESRALVLFGTLGVWALLEMLFINRREGPRERPAAQPIRAEIKPFVASLLVFAVLFLLHPYFSGVSLRATP